MTDAVDREVARRLYAQGWKQIELAREYDVSPTTIRRWVLPGVREAELAVSRDWKARHKEHLRRYDRAYVQRKRRTCPQCGGLMEHDATLCQACRNENAETRRSIIVGCWQDGWKIREIADAVGSNVNSLSVTLNRLRQAGRIGYRHHGYDTYTTGNGTAPTLARCSPSSSPARCSPSPSSTSRTCSPDTSTTNASTVSRTSPNAKRSKTPAPLPAP